MNTIKNKSLKERKRTTRHDDFHAIALGIYVGH